MAIHLADIAAASLSDRYRRTREQSLALIAELQPEDTVVQSMPDVSPSKWHLAHVTWFFERFVLEPNVRNYSRFDEQYHYLFNSYYYTAGQMHARPKRGLLSRPTLRQVLDYRSYVDAAMQQLLQTGEADEHTISVIVLGLNHEQQHQELLLTDIKHVFSCNPLQPPVSRSLESALGGELAAYSFTNGESGIHQVGAKGDGFVFDNETPRHDALLQEHQVGNRLISNGEYRDFIRDGGYDSSELWLSDGWATINEQVQIHGETVNEEMIQEFLTVLDPVIDFDSIARAVMSSEKDRVNANQIERFTNVFKHTMVRLYLESFIVFEVNEIVVKHVSVDKI